MVVVEVLRIKGNESGEVQIQIKSLVLSLEQCCVEFIVESVLNWTLNRPSISQGVLRRLLWSRNANQVFAC